MIVELAFTAAEIREYIKALDVAARGYALNGDDAERVARLLRTLRSVEVQS